MATDEVYGTIYIHGERFPFLHSHGVFVLSHERWPVKGAGVYLQDAIRTIKEDARRLVSSGKAPAELIEWVSEV